MGKISFFVIEDHSLTNLGIRQSITGNTDFTCVGFASSESEAFDKLSELSLKSSLPSVIVLDLLLGSESGIDVLKEVRRHFPATNVLVYSMYSNPGIVNLVLENGAKGFVSKSSEESELIQAVKKIAAGEVYVQEALLTPLTTYKNLLDSLTKTEKSILNKVIERLPDAEICSELELSSASYQNYLLRIYSKTGTKNTDELIRQFG